ncbi:T6SS protein Cts2N [Citrobacter farmeri]|nr:T6SS protein Cts2N [Citrobacter farmeri]
MTNGISHVARIIFMTCLALLNNGCSFWSNQVELKTVVIDTAADANDNTPVAVDIVAIADASLVPVVQTLSATQWFNARAQLQRDYPGGLQVWSLELVPGSRFTADDNPLSGAPAEATLLFARYRSEGEHRLRLDKTTALHLQLMADEAVLAPEQGK